jgi:magnesium transporter
MLHIFTANKGRLIKQTSLHDIVPGEGLIWIDAVSPTDEEREAVSGIFKVGLELAEDDSDIETSARIFLDRFEYLNIRADFLVEIGGRITTEPVRFVVADKFLFSIHEEDLPIIRLMRMRSKADRRSWSSSLQIVTELFALDVEQSADVLEDVYQALKLINDRVLAEKKGSNEEAEEYIQLIAKEEEVNGTVRRNLMDTRLVLSYLVREQQLPKELVGQVKIIQRDIESLDGHTSFIFDKINFLMDAVMGFINIKQNKIIKIFSVASVAMLPPTLIASIYGMNFEYMPELAQRWGYPFSLGLMVVSVIIPFYYFKRKGWMK